MHADEHCTLFTSSCGLHVISLKVDGVKTKRFARLISNVGSGSQVLADVTCPRIQLGECK
jgi:hypothetical protein